MPVTPISAIYHTQKPCQDTGYQDSQGDIPNPENVRMKKPVDHENGYYTGTHPNCDGSLRTDGSENGQQKRS
jgi:hypothetical protein